ncbi:hypothetical protein BraRD5C2_38310 [Bradyrhizobium sp. RD5-C2]|nr:hypothetical protein BraRD5C2_38310 [Bradyrhizobium sp. RD5-C2]
MDRDFQSIYGLFWPVRTSETLLTAVCQYEVRSGTERSGPPPSRGRRDQPDRDDTRGVPKDAVCLACGPL